MKIVADDKIPFVTELFSPIGNVVQIPGGSIQQKDLVDADVLITRTITEVNAALLENTAVKFVGSATAGHDHLDTAWLKHANIPWSCAAGANAQAVTDYVISCIAYLQKEGLLSQTARAGIIGVGRIGSKVAKCLQALGLTVLYNDPPRADNETDFDSTDLTEFYDLDLICLHTPLIKSGSFPTYHLINDSFLKNLNPSCVLLNAGRGAVVDNQALINSNLNTFCLDVWENEPAINLDLLKKSTLATPHIAGYSVEAKFAATYIIYEEILNYFYLPNTEHSFNELNPPTFITADKNESWQDIVLRVYNPLNDANIMKKELLNNPSNSANIFHDLRRHYKFRHEFSSYKLQANVSPITKALLNMLGFS